MTDQTLPEALQNILEKHSEPDAVFTALLPALGEVLECVDAERLVVRHRCFLYLRNPNSKVGKVAYCWRRSQQIPEVINPDWQDEPAWLPEEDPMFAAAILTKPSIYVEDVEAASPEVLNREFERKEFGHRALIHSHLVWDGQLWGILQPCVFGEKRVWSDFDRAVISQLEVRLAPLAAAYVKAAGV